MLEKTLKDVTWDKNKVILVLTQEDTLKFDVGTVLIQHRVKFYDGSSMASNLIYTTAKAILKEGAI